MFECTEIPVAGSEGYRGWHPHFIEKIVMQFMCKIDKTMSNYVLATPFSVEPGWHPSFPKCRDPLLIDLTCM